MPCATIHLLLADSVLEDWRRDPASAPLEADRPAIRDAFIHGALAPDMGFVPGVDRFVSELAHYVRPGVLTRNLMAAAESATDEAFAWGWATHVLGDVQIHPIVGRAVGERLYGDRNRRVDAEVDVATHVGTEVGLDIVFHLRNPTVSRPPRAPHFNARRIEQLVTALHGTYGISWSAAGLLADHRRAVRRCRPWPLVLRSLAPGLGTCETESPPAHPLRRLCERGFSALAALLPAGTPARGLFTPHPPPSWMVEEVDEAIRTFPERCRILSREGFAAVPDRNLETGESAGEGRGHPASDEAARKLAGRIRGERSVGSPSDGIEVTG